MKYFRMIVIICVMSMTLPLLTGYGKKNSSDTEESWLNEYTISDHLFTPKPVYEINMNDDEDKDGFFQGTWR